MQVLNQFIYGEKERIQRGQSTISEKAVISGRNVFVTNKVDELNLLKSKYASLDTDVVIDGE